MSQCNHCRDLRITNKSHVKCTCAIASGTYNACLKARCIHLIFLLAPNPINGCLCEVILSCTCVASHLQDVKEDNDSSVYTASPTLVNSSFCSTPPPAMISSSESDNQKEDSILLQSIQDDNADLMNFLINDLDKYIVMPHGTNSVL